MHIIYLKPLEPEVYNDLNSNTISSPPEGAAMIPDDLEKPSTFPRLGSITAEDVTYTYEVEVEKVNEETGEPYTVMEQRERTILTVTDWTESTLPIPEPEAETEPTAEEMLNAMLGVTSYE